MKTNYLRTGSAWLLVFLFLFVGAPYVRAEIELIPDKLTMVGYFRQQTVVSMGLQSPYNKAWGQTDKNDFTLSRTWFVTELDYTPNDIFKLHTQFRVIHDQTRNLDNDLLDYESFQDYEVYKHADLRAGEDNDIVAEIWELYGDLDLGNLWLRLGRQQIAWGEMISIRILDMINPLDRAWHFQWEPEEFENIRIPQWMLRGVYSIEQSLVPWLEELYIEGFLNPGDVRGNIDPTAGMPYNLRGQLLDPRPPFAGGTGLPMYNTVYTQDTKGKDEFGFRLGYKIWDLAGTLNYYYVRPDGAVVYCPAGGPPSMAPVYEYYPRQDWYGASLNYACPDGTVISVEGKYTDDAYFYDNSSPPGTTFIWPEKVDYYKWAINFQRFTRVLRTEPFMNIQLQYSQVVIPHHYTQCIKMNPAPYGKTNHVEEVVDTIALILNQDFRYKTYKASCVILYQPDKAYRINPGFKYSPGDHWRFEVYANWWGGSAGNHANNNQQLLSYFNYQDEFMGRITYQF